MDIPGVYYKETNVDAFWEQFAGYSYFNDDKEAWITELKKKAVMNTQTKIGKVYFQKQKKQVI